MDDLRGMFADMRERYDWDVDGKLRWGYFFTDANPKKLEPVADYLTEAGYRFVAIFQSEQDDADESADTYVLHVERIEHHTRETLDERNQEFYRVASRFNLESYDGMDVGPVEAVDGTLD
jgi:hypothetical protein